MTTPCYYHPDKIASATCVQCGLPTCTECTDRVAEKPVCFKCVNAVRERLEKQMAATPAGAYGALPSSQSYQPNTYGGAAPTSNGQSFGGSNYVLPAEPTDIGKLILGIVIALVISIVGAIAVEKITLATGWEIAYLFVAVGYGIGIGLHRITGRGGMGMALLAVGIMVIGLGVGQVVYTADDQAMRLNNTPHRSIDSFYWICAAIGLYSCFRGMMRRA